MTVNELIKFLILQPQDLKVAHRMYSENCLLKAEDIEIAELCIPRDDGWIQNMRPDKPTQKYLLLPGN